MPEQPQAEFYTGGVDSLRYALRVYSPAVDEGLVMDSWKKVIRPSPPFSLMQYRDVALHKTTIRDLVDRCPPVMACHKDHPEQVFGWICAEQAIDPRPDAEHDLQVLHMVYVRGGWRQMKIGTNLMRCSFPALGKRPVYYTHITKMSRYHVHRWLLVYNPYLVVNP